MSESKIRALNEQGATLYKQCRFAEAIPLAKQLVHLTWDHYGADSPHYAESLNNLAGLYQKLGDFAQAERLHKAALAIVEQIYKGEPHPGVATSLNYLARLYYSYGDFARAESFCLRALAVLEAVYDEEHPEVFLSLTILAGLYKTRGDFAQAERLYRRALTIGERVFGEEDPEVATGLANLAGLYQELGDFAQAERLHKAALAIREQVYKGAPHTAVASSLNNLAEFYQTLGDFAQAEPLYQRALAIWEQVYKGAPNPDVASSLDNLAGLYTSLGRYSEAEPLYQCAIVIREQALGQEHPAVATSLNNLAVHYHDLRDYVQAELFARRALAIREKALGKEHPDVAGSLNDLAGLLAATGRYAEALLLLSEGTQIESTLLASLAGALPERQLLTFARMIEGDAHVMLTLVWRYLGHDADAVRAALDLVLKRKAFALEATAARHEAALSGTYPALQSLFDKLHQVRMELARATLAGPPQVAEQAIEVHRHRLDELKERCEVLERDLAREVPEVALQQRLRAVDRQAVALNLPPETVLVEFARFDPYRFEAVGTAPRLEAPRYLAFILLAGEPDAVQMIDLGEAAGIDALIATFRTHVIGPTRGPGAERPEADPHPLLDVCRELYGRLFQPLLQALGEDRDRRLLLSPDGELNLLPFETLLDAEGRFVIEAHRVSYVASGRDVLRFGQRLGEPGEALIVADPDFDLCASEPAADPVDGSPREERFATTREGRSRDFRAEVDLFERLSSTRAEGEHITALLRQKGVPVRDPWFDREALEAPLKSVRAPLILHLATHGFFESDQARTPEDGSRGLSLRGSREGVPLAANIENPLLRSGLALAGANAQLRQRSQAPQAEDGILTALDVCGLNLYGTELVTLSACDTGVGEVRRGEGVFGLRRAFHQAGAKSLVMSLWQVPDEETQLLMEQFYQHLLAGQSKPDALREAQLSVIREMRERHVQPDFCGLAHPFFWAAFICQGDPAPMERGAPREG